GEVLPHLERGHLGLVRQQVRGDPHDAAVLQAGQDAQVGDQPADGGRGYVPRRAAGAPAWHQRGKLSIPADSSRVWADASSEASNGPTSSLTRPFSTLSVTTKPMASRRWRCGRELSREAYAPTWR